MKRRIFDWLLLIVVTSSLTILPACGTISALNESVQAIREVVPAVQETVSNFKQITEFTQDKIEGASSEVKAALAEWKKIQEEAKIKADKNQDGEISGMAEWLQYLILLGAGGSGYFVRRVQQVSKEKKDRDSEVKERLDKLEGK